MKPVWKWIIGVVVILLVLSSVAAPLFMHLFWGYGMMSGYGYGSGWSMPMMGGFAFGPSMMSGGFGSGWLFSGLIQLGVLTLIVLGIIWLVRELKRQDQHSN